LIPGQLRHKVTIQKKGSGVSDGGGNIIPNWVNIAEVWANVNADPFDKTVANQSVQQSTHTVKIRYRSDLTTAHRLLFNGRVLDIKYIKNTNEANRELILSCLEG
jgi:SPP1 family predicted phage head-tail adaptor